MTPKKKGKKKKPLIWPLQRRKVNLCPDMVDRAGHIPS